MDEQDDERSAQIDEALRRSQQQERDEAAHDLRRQADTDEAIIAALTREQERQRVADDAEVSETAPPVDAPPVDAPPVDAPPVDAPPVDAPPVDAPEDTPLG